MAFSELEFLKDDFGLAWDSEKLCLYGSLNDYFVFVYDNSDIREYVVTIFYKVRSDVEESLKKEVTGLLNNMPKNSVVGRKDEVRYTSVRFNAAQLYQEKSVYLAQFVKELCNLANRLELVPIAPDEKERDMAAPPKAVIAPTEKKPVKKPKNAILKGFDKYSVKGLFGALAGGLAMTVIAASVTAINPSNTGAYIASLVAGALIAAVVLADYLFFAKKIDIFGAIVCSLITIVCCFAAADFGTLRGLYLAMRNIAPEVTLNMTMENWSYYQIFFPEVTDRFTLMLVQNYLSAILASVLFFTLYFRVHQGVMFGKGREVLDENKARKKKR